MGQIQKQLQFKAPLEKVWRIWTDVEKTPEWVEGVQESKITSTEREGKGLSWKEKCLFGKQVIQMEHEMKEWEPMKRTFAHTGLPMGGTMETAADFREVAGGTEVDLSVEWDLGFVGGMIGEERLHHMMDKSFNLTADKWKHKAETP
ncbi:MAG TPA: SRPBCC family protein [bacterium]|nr:SRPBCC family protein [bacterium]